MKRKYWILKYRRSDEFLEKLIGLHYAEACTPKDLEQIMQAWLEACEPGGYVALYPGRLDGRVAEMAEKPVLRLSKEVTGNLLLT